MASVTPPPPYVPPQGATPQTPVDGEAIPAQITSLPPALQSTDRTLTLRGEVQAVNDDGTVRIATPRGPVDVKLPEPIPARGTSVEVEIPAGSPPRTVTVTLPAQTQTPQQPQPQTPPLIPTSTQPQPVPTLPQAPLPQGPVAQSPAPSPAQPQAPVSQTLAAPTPAQTTPAPVQTSTPTPIPVTISSSAPVLQPAPVALPSAIPLLQQAQSETPEVTPQGLMNFLKNSLQTFLKTPDATPVNTAVTPNTAGAVQRPLQIGQMVRLTPLQPGQMPQQTTTQPQLPQGAPQLATPARITIAAPATVTPGLNTAAPLAVPTTPTAIPQTQNTPLLNMLKTVLGQNVTITATPSAAQIPATAIPSTVTPTPIATSADPMTRVLLPLLNFTAAPANTAVATPPLTAQMTLATPTPIVQGATTPQAFVISTPAAPNAAMALPQNLDVRVSGLFPTASAGMLQSPMTATLLHGTPAAPVIFASVAGQTSQGLPVVELPTFTVASDGTAKASPTLMVLQFPARGLAPATILKLDILPGTQAFTAPTAAASAAQGGASAVTWDTLDDILHEIPTQPQTQTAQAAIQAALPKPGSVAFTAPVLMFVAALRGGDVTAWMGEKGLDAISRTARRADALAKIGGDFATSAKRLLADEAKPAGEWRSLNLPMLYGAEVARVQMHYRSFDRDSDDAKAPGKQTGTRFVMDLSLTRMGPLQIDGFSVGKKLDVTLRSEQSLSPAMRETMRTRYHDAVEGIGFAGDLNFNASADHKGWIVIDEGSSPVAHTGIGA